MQVVNGSFSVALLLQGNHLCMSPRLHVNPVNIHNIRILLILRLDSDLAGERESAPRLKDERSIADSDWLRAAIAHVDVEAYLLNGEVLGLADKQLPDVFLLGLGEDGLFGLQLARVVAYLQVDDAFEHSLHPMKLPLSPQYIAAGHILDQLIMKLLVLGLLGDLGPAERALLVDEQ